LGWSWRQPDVGYLAICLLEKIGLATDVRHIRQESAQEGTQKNPQASQQISPQATPTAESA
jgi:hypothetical protein